MKSKRFTLLINHLLTNSVNTRSNNDEESLGMEVQPFLDPNADKTPKGGCLGNVQGISKTD